MTSGRTWVLVVTALAVTAPGRAAAQSLGTFRWQLQPYCNVVTVNVVQSGAVYTLDGYDDQCGAATRAPLVGLATPNPDGTIGFGLTISTPTGEAVHVDATITLAAFSGTWRDSTGATGPFAFGASTGGSPRPAVAAFVPVSAAANNTFTGKQNFNGGLTATTVSGGAMSASTLDVSDALAAHTATVDALTVTSLTSSSLTTPNLATAGAADVVVTGTLYARALYLTDAVASVNGYGVAPEFNAFRWNGTPANPGAVVSGDRLASFRFYGALGGGARRQGAAIHAAATENWFTGNGASLTFETGPNGSNVTLPRLFIDQNGEVGIGTLTPDQLLSVNGNASKVGGGTWAVFSDERLKTLRGPFNRGLADVMRLQPLRFEYRPDNPLGLKGQGEYVGFSAQAVRDVIPEAVSASTDGYLQLQSDPLLWAMLNAIKELKAENDRLRAEIDVRLKRLEGAAPPR